LPNPLRERLDAPHGDQEVPENPEVFINQRAFEAAQEFRPRAANLPAQNEPLNFLPRENPPLRNNQSNPPLNVPPLNCAERVLGEKENNEQNVPTVSVQQRYRPVRDLPQVRPVEAYNADEENDSPHSATHPIPSPQPQLPVFSDRQPHFLAHSAAFPNPLLWRACAQRRAASVEVDHPCAHAEEAPPMAAPASGPHMSLPKLKLPAFKGEKGAKAQIWLESLGRFQKFYRMTDEQAVELARFSCKGPYAKAWAGLLPDDLTLKTFKEHFKAEFAVENQNKLMSELLERVQKDGVGEYATEMMEYIKMLQLDEKTRIRHFVRDLKFGIKETVLASLPPSPLVALRKAKEAETAYELSGKNRGPLDGINCELSQTVQRTVQEEVNLLRRRSGNDQFFSRPGNAFFARDRPQGERARERFDRGRLRYPERDGRDKGRESPLRRESPRPRNRFPIALRKRSPVPREPAQANQLNQAPPPPPQNPGRCHRCLQRGHGVPTCPNPIAVPQNDCCGWYGSHHNRFSNHPRKTWLLREGNRVKPMFSK
jgi:hypothetical protein